MLVKVIVGWCVLIAACGPRPARMVCMPLGGGAACVQRGPDRCHPDHPSYDNDIAEGRCK